MAPIRSTAPYRALFFHLLLHGDTHHGQKRRLPLGRPLSSRPATERWRAHGARRGCGLLPGQAGTARARGLPPREDGREHLSRDGRSGPAGPHHPRAVRRPGPELCGLRPDRPRSGARGFGLPLDGQRAELAGDGADLW